MKRTLVFNPFYRISVDECLAHPLFKAVRNPDYEAFKTASVVLDFESEKNLGPERLRTLILNECAHYVN